MQANADLWDTGIKKTVDVEASSPPIEILPKERALTDFIVTAMVVLPGDNGYEERDGI
jgi:hypothetical protein